MRGFLARLVGESHATTPAQTPAASIECEERGFRHAILLEEYRAVRSEIERRLGWQHQVIVVGATTLAALAGVVLAFAAPSEKPVATFLVLLSVAYLSAVLAMVMVNIDRVVQDLASYQERVLRPELEKLAGAPVLGWEAFYRRVSYSKELTIGQRLPRVLTAVFPHAFFLLPGWVTILLAGLMVSSRTPSVSSAVYLTLFGLAVAGLGYTTVTSVVGGMRYSRLHRNVSNKRIHADSVSRVVDSGGERSPEYRW